ncbi:MAG: GGDEF domain-containing protein [Acidobacteriaceae bacterium]
MQMPIQTAREIVLNAMPVGVSWASVADQKILFTNRAFIQLFGYGAGDFTNIADWIKGVCAFPEDLALAMGKWGAAFAAMDNVELTIDPMELRIRCKDGTIKTIINSGVVLPEVGWALAIFVDITDRKRNEIRLQEAEQEARESQAIYRLLIESSTEMIVLAPFDAPRRYVSPAVQKITGFTVQEYLALKAWEMIHPDDRETVIGGIEAIKSGERSRVFRYRALQKDGSYRWVEAGVAGYTDPVSKKPAGYVATIRDIAEQVKHEKLLASQYHRLSEVATLDELTGIANRRAFNQTFEREALRHTRSSRDLAILMIDVDRFKQYNDLYGHLSGDICLRKIAECLKKTLRRDSDMVARFGGEEFIILAPMTEAAGAETIARNILQAMADLAIPHEASPNSIVTLSIGGACWPARRPLDRSLLIERADQALYQAKDSGRNTFRILV